MSIDRDFIENRLHTFVPFNATWHKPRCQHCQEFEEHPIHRRFEVEEVVLQKTKDGTVSVRWEEDPILGSIFSLVTELPGPFDMPLIVTTKLRVHDAQRLARFILREDPEEPKDNE